MGKIISFKKELAKWEKQHNEDEDILLEVEKEDLEYSEMEQYLEEYIDWAGENILSENKKKDKAIGAKFVFTPQSEEEKGVLVWLYCPHCKSLEYSEIISSKGRTHKCGTEVLEKEVVIDITAEYTVCKRNLFFLERVEQDFVKNIIKEKKKKQQDFIIFKELIKGLKDIECTMIAKLKKISHKKELVVYIWTKNNPKLIASMNSLGLAISNFHFQPEERFKTLVTKTIKDNEKEPLDD